MYERICCIIYNFHQQLLVYQFRSLAQTFSVMHLNVVAIGWGWICSFKMKVRKNVSMFQKSIHHT